MHFQIPRGPERSMWDLKFPSEVQDEELTASGRRSGQLQHAVLRQDALGSCVHEGQGVDDGAQDGRGLLLALHAHQLQEVLSVRESVEDQLCSLTEEPGVVGGQRHLVGVP